jgi:hypothetical protein
MASFIRDDVTILPEEDPRDDVFLEDQDGDQREVQICQRTIPTYKSEDKRRTNYCNVIQRPYPDKDDSVKYVTSFDSEFTNIIGISPISDTKAWVYNLDHAKLIDIKKGEFLCEYNALYIQGNFCHLKGLDESRVLFLDTVENKIYRMTVKNSHFTVIDNNSEIVCMPHVRVLVFTTLQSGEIVTCVNKKEGFLCLKKDVPYIQLHSIYGNLKRESKLQHNGKNLLREAYDMVENKNGDICIAAEKCTEPYSEWVVVLDMNFKFRFTYEGEADSNFSSASLTVGSNNTILIVNQLQFIDVIDENGKYLRRLPVDSFSPDGVPNRISVDCVGKIWIITGLDKIVCLQLQQSLTF